MNAPLAQAHKDRPSGHVHEMIAEVAKAAAHEAYDALVTDSNHIYSAWKAQHPGMGAKALEARFVAKYWSAYIPLARSTLAEMLTRSIDASLKTRIHEALVLDASLVRGRVEPNQGIAN